MLLADIPEKISQKDFDLQGFVNQTFEDQAVRDEIVRLLVEREDIMVYYHCYYVLDQASRERPDLFYPYWAIFAPLLHHSNSYHRDFALTLLANLTAVDSAERFAGLSEEYFDHMADEKFMTGQCCVRNVRKIFQNKPGYQGQILSLLLSIDQNSKYSEKQKALLKCDILDIFETIYQDVSDRRLLDRFILDERASISPKTRAKAKALTQKFHLTLGS